MISEDILIVLETMASQTSGLTATERNAVERALQHLIFDELNMCKRILYMINNNEATIDDVKNFCETFIKSKEENING